MLKIKRRSYLVAGASVFAVVYSILGLFPVAPYIGVSSLLTFREVLSPLSGMLFGPVIGGASMILGTFVDFSLGKPVVFDFLDFVPDLASSVLAGLAFSGRRKAALALPLVLIGWYSLDPLSARWINVNGTLVPFVWMHLVSVGVLGCVLFLERKGTIRRIGPIFVGGTAFASTMCGHVAGGILFENIVARVNGTLTPQQLQGVWGAIFYAYPAERLLFTILGTAVSLPVLRALSRSHGTPTTASG